MEDRQYISLASTIAGPKKSGLREISHLKNGDITSQITKNECHLSSIIDNGRHFSSSNGVTRSRSLQQRGGVGSIGGREEGRRSSSSSFDLLLFSANEAAKSLHPAPGRQRSRPLLPRDGQQQLREENVDYCNCKGS